MLVLRVTTMNTMQSLFAFQCEVAIELKRKNGERFMCSFKNIWIPMIHDVYAGGTKEDMYPVFPELMACQGKHGDVLITISAIMETWGCFRAHSKGRGNDSTDFQKQKHKTAGNCEDTAKIKLRNEGLVGLKFILSNSKWESIKSGINADLRLLPKVWV